MKQLLFLLLMVSPLVISPCHAGDEFALWLKEQRKLHAHNPTGRLNLDLDIRHPAVVPRDVINENRDWSYIMLGAGIHANDYVAADALNFEAELNHHFNWFDYYYGANRVITVDVPVRIHLRQTRGDSSPVRTPSYNPGIRLTFWKNDSVLTGRFFSYPSLGFYHYSNGQEGEAVNADGSLNTINGSFSTDYFELAHNLAGDYGPLDWMRFSLRQHLTDRSWESYQSGQYATGEMRFQMKSERFFFFTMPSHLELDLGYKYAGRDYVVKNEIDPSKSVEATLSDNLQWTVKFVFGSFLWTHLKWFVRYDHGYDNYNIHFQQPLQRLSIGITGHNFDYY